MSQDLQQNIELMKEATRVLSEEVGIVLSKTKNIVSFPNDPNREEEERRVQKQIDALIAGSLMLYLYAMWDDLTTDKIQSFLNAEEKKTLRAYKHIRHSVGHKFRGGRAGDCRKEFEELYEAGKLTNVYWDKENDTIDISNGGVVVEYSIFMKNIAQELTARVAKADIKQQSGV